MAEAVVEILLRARDETRQTVKQLEQSLEKATKAAKELAAARSDKLEKGLDKTAKAAKDLDQHATKAKRSLTQVARVKLTRLVQQLREANKQSKQLGDRFRNLGGSIAGAGVGVAALGGSITAVFAGAISTFVDFEKSLNRIKAITQATDVQMQAITDTAAELGRTTAFTAREAADAFIFLAQAGLTVDQQLGAIKNTLELAAAGQLDLAEAADIATNVLQGLNLEVSELGRVNDALAFTASKTNTNIRELGEALVIAAPAVAAVGESLETATAILGAFANAGTKGSRAGTQLRQLMIRMVAPVGRAKDALAALGVETTTASGEFRGLTAVLKDFNAVGLGGDLASASKIFGVYTATAALAAVNTIEVTEKLIKATKAAKGFAAQVAATQLEGLSGDLIKLKSAAEGVALAIGQKLAPALRPIIQSITDAASSFGKFIEGLSATERKILAAVAVVGVLTLAVGALAVVVGGFLLLVAPLAGFFSVAGVLIGVAVAALVALGIAFHEVIGEVATFVIELLRSLPVIKQVISVFNFLSEKLFGSADAAKEARIEQEKLIETLAKFDKTVGAAITEGLVDAPIAEAIAELRRKVEEGLIPGDVGQDLLRKFVGSVATANTEIAKSEKKIKELRERLKIEEKAKATATEIERTDTLIAISEKAVKEWKKQQLEVLTFIAESAKRRKQIEKDVAAERIRISTSLASDLKSIEKAIEGVKDRGLSEEAQQTKILRTTIADLKKARADLLTATTQDERDQVQAAIDQAVAAAQKLDSDEAALKILKEAKSTRELLAARETILNIKAGQEAETAEQKRIKGAEKQVADLVEVIKLEEKRIRGLEAAKVTLEEGIKVPIEVKIDEAIRELDFFKDKLAELKSTTIEVTVKPRVGARPEGFAAGGEVPGFGRGDRVPALLEPKEFVVRRERAQKFGSLLAALNSGSRTEILNVLQTLNVPKFQAGGFVAPQISSSDVMIPGGASSTENIVNTSERVIDVVKVDLSVGGQSIGPVTGARSTVDSLLEVLTDTQRGLATG